MKKFLALLLCLSMILTLMPAVFATETETTEPTTTETTAATEAATEPATEATTEATTEPATEATEATTVETTTETTEATEETTEETTEATEETTEPTEGESFATFTMLNGNPVEVGDKIWIKNKQLVYKSTTDTEGYKTLLHHEITIKAITDVGDTTWFRFENGALNILGYKYVKASSTSTTEPGENDCDCGSDSENLADHADDCARKKYVLSLIQKDGEFKTAEEIFADWDSFDEDTKTDIWALLDTMDPELSGELEQIIEDDANGFRTKYETFTDSSAKGISASISAVEGQFPEGTTVTVTDTTVSIDSVRNQISGDVLGVVAVDISFGGHQPNGNVVVTLNIPANQAVSGANMVYIVHNGTEIITSQYLSTTSTAKSITFGTSSFSSYAAVFVNGKYSSQKMSNVLATDSRYSIHNFSVKLFDYDPTQMNSSLRNLGSNAFIFRGFGSSETEGGTSGVNDSTAEYAKQGIVQNKLVNSLPVFNYVSDGTKTGEYLFGTTVLEGKTQYSPNFQFVYDSQTGYYQYKSSANHAQYNQLNNTIELYADTLSTQNKYVATLDLSTGSEAYDYKNITKTKDSYKATAYKSNVDNRLDPYVSFTVPNQSADTDENGNIKVKGYSTADINKIYVKAKVPKSVGKNYFMLYFKNTNDEAYKHYSGSEGDVRQFAVEYTPNDGYVEFVIDTSTNSLWKKMGTVTDIRVDLFDGNLGTVDQTKQYNIEITQISLIKDYDNYVTRGGFYPFSNIANSYPGNGSNYTKYGWEDTMSANDKVNVLSSRSIGNPSDSTADLTKNLYFGVVMEFDFYIPVDKKVNNEDLTYYFNGDDDLWVFIDGELALDIGGGHGGITGEINLTQGTTTVNNAVKVSGYDSNEGNAQKVSGTLNGSLTAPGKHTMKIFYMERCGSVSNCFMKFNLPQTPQGSLTVSKDVLDNDGNDIDALKNETFTFTISGTFNDSSKAALEVSGLTYKLFDSTTGKTEEKTVSANGIFTLTATQTAVFDIDENYNVTVTETEPSKEDTKGYQYVSTKVNDTEGASKTELTVKDQQLKFQFVNIYQPLYGSIQITKTGISGLDNDGTTEKQSSVFHVEGTSTTGKQLSMDVVIVGNGSKTILRVPVGTYTVTEKTNWTWRYDEQNEQSVTVTGPETTEQVTFNNVRKKEFWLSGDNWCENYWGTKEKQADSAATT